MVETAMHIVDIDKRDKERLTLFWLEGKLELLAALLSDMEKSGQLKQMKTIISAIGSGNKSRMSIPVEKG